MNDRSGWLVAIAALCLCGAARGDATRFAPGAISIDGRLTLTPSFTPDGNTAFYAQSACADVGACPQTMHRARRRDGEWLRGEPVTLPSPGRVDWPSVSPDGRYLYFSWSAPRQKYDGLDVYEDFDLYRLALADDRALPTPLDAADINRPRAGAIRKTAYYHNSTHPVLTASGDLYFWSQRIDAVGERDIFFAPADGRGGWEIARPMGPPINSTGRDHHAWVSPNGGLMLISYPDRGGRGDDDIFVSRKSEGRWSEPRNLGARINSRYADFAARMTPDASHIVFTSNRPYETDRPGGTLQVWQVATADLIIAGSLTTADLSR